MTFYKDTVYFLCDAYFERSITAAERHNRGSSYRLVVCFLKMHIPNDYQKCPNNNNYKERLSKIIKETLLSHNNRSIDRNIYFARESACELLPRGYGDDTFTVNHKETDTILISLVKHEIKHEENQNMPLSLYD